MITIPFTPTVLLADDSPPLPNVAAAVETVFTGEMSVGFADLLEVAAPVPVTPTLSNGERLIVEEEENVEQQENDEYCVSEYESATNRLTGVTSFAEPPQLAVVESQRQLVSLADPILPTPTQASTLLVNPLLTCLDSFSSSPLPRSSRSFPVEKATLPSASSVAVDRIGLAKLDATLLAKNDVPVLAHTVLAGEGSLLAHDISLSTNDSLTSVTPSWLSRVPSGGNTLLPDGVPVKLPVEKPAQWGEALRAVLGERINVQSGQGFDRALIRIDPHSLGSLEIIIRHEAGALSVQLVASHGDVVRQLQGISELLRQDLSTRQFTQVAVEVYEGMPGGNQGQERSFQGAPQQPRTPGRALAEAQGDDVVEDGFTLGPG